MASFWDERARENAWFFIDDQLDYASPDMDAFWAGGRHAVDVILERLGVEIESSDLILEIGCGAGRMTRELARRGREVVALDVSAEMLELGRAHNPQVDNVEWVLGDGSSLSSVADNTIDACMSFVVFQHIPDPAVTLAYVREMGRVLRPGGWSAFQVSNDPHLHRPRDPDPVHDEESAPSGTDQPEWLGGAVSVAEIRKAAAETGMDIESTDGEGTQFCLVLLRKSRQEG